jgi:TPR repeat protein
MPQPAHCSRLHRLRCVALLAALGAVAPLHVAPQALAASASAEARATPAQLLEQGRAAMIGGSFDDAQRLLRQATTEGAAAAMTTLGQMHQHGYGMPASEQQALVWYRKADAAGDGEGTARLGYLLAQGASPTEHLQSRGVARDEAMAINLLESAVAAGDPSAQRALGMLYLEGRGVQEHPSMAAILLTEAARQGEMPAQARLGLLYRDGWGVERDEFEAAYWLERAAERGNVEAMAQLALLLVNGSEIPKDPARAVELLQQAAAAGNPLAQFELGRLMLEGRNLPQDAKQGIALIRRAADTGFSAANRFLKETQL